MKSKRKSAAKITRAQRPVPLLAPPNQRGQSAARNGGGTRSRQPNNSMTRPRKHAETLGGGKLCDLFCGRPGQVSSSRGRQGIPDVSPCSWVCCAAGGAGYPPLRPGGSRGLAAQTLGRPQARPGAGTVLAALRPLRPVGAPGSSLSSRAGGCLSAAVARVPGRCLAQRAAYGEGTARAKRDPGAR